MKASSRIKAYIFLMAWLPLTASAAKPPAALSKPISIPAYDELDAEALNLQVRSALTAAAEFLKTRAAADDEGWIVPPVRTRQVVDHKTIVISYREQEVEVPVMKHEYETYEVNVASKHGHSADAVRTIQKVKRRRVVSSKQVGTKTVTRLVRDPDGSIQRNHNVPIYGPGGPDVWYRNVLGDNALALFALRYAGVRTDNITIDTLASNLQNFLIDYGYPDATWDLAWMTAAFSSMTSEKHRETAEALASKLLDGQIREGQAAGLWGPVAVNPAMLAEITSEIQESGAALLPLKRIREPSKKEARKLLEAEGRYIRARSILHKVAMMGMAGQSINTHVAVESDGGSPIRMEGLTHYIYNQTTADLESTALVLYALRQAAENGVFPKALWRPDQSKVEAETPEALLQASITTLAKHRAGAGDWDEMNRHQPVTDLSESRIFPGLPGAETPFPKLPSPAHVLSRVQGFSAMSDAVAILGFSKLDRSLRRPFAEGYATYIHSAEQLLSSWPEEGINGSNYMPFDGCLFLSDCALHPGTRKETRRDLWMRLAHGLLARHTDQGGWTQRMPHGQRFIMPTSLNARLAAMEPPEPRTPVDYSQPHIPALFWGRLKARERFKNRPGVIKDIVPTSFSMIFLADGVRPPVAGECSWSDTAGSSQLIPMIKTVMQKRHGIAFRHAVVKRPLQEKTVMDLPGLLIRGSGTFDPSPEEEKVLQAYLSRGGLVLIEVSADADGATFLRESKMLLESLFAEPPAFENVGDDKDLLGTAAGQARIWSFKKANGTLAAAFFPLARNKAKGGLPSSTAARAAFNLLLQKLDPALLEKDYPITIDQHETHQADEGE